MHSHLTRDMGQYFVAVIQFYPEHRVRKRFNDRSFNFNCFFFSHVRLRVATGSFPLDQKPGRPAVFRCRYILVRLTGYFFSSLLI